MPMPALPPGFKLDSDVPPLPEGFTLDSAEIPSSGPGEPHRGRYVSPAEKQRRAEAADPWTYDPESGAKIPLSQLNPLGAGMVGGAEAALSMATGTAAMPVAGYAGMIGGKDTVEKVQNAMTYQPRTEAGKKASAIASYPFEKLGQGARWTGEKVQDITGSPLLATVADTTVQAVPALLSRGRVRRNVDPGANPPGPRLGISEEAQAAPAAPKAGRNPGLERVPDKAAEAPSLEDLRSEKDAAYKRAENTGVVISRNALTRLKVELVNDLQKEGIDKDLHPKATAAVKRILDSKGQLKLSEIETLRKIANDAKGSIEKSDARLGARIVDKLDDFEANLSESDVVSGSPEAATAYKEARALNTRVSKAQDIGDLFERAKNKAGANFSQSGMENALRQEFKALANNKNRMRRFTPEEKAAIQRVARGAPLENAMRMLGKFAPTGGVSGPLGVMLGASGFGVIPAAGMAGRAVATRMTMRNANAAEQLMRRGPVNQIAKTPDPVAERRNYFAEKP